MNSIKGSWLTAISVFSGAVMGTIDTFILYVATPHLRGTFSATTVEASWISTSYAASALIFMLLSSWICQKFETKKVYQTSLLLFVLSSILCGASESLQQLILARILQGASAGILIPAENVILRRTFPLSQHGLVIGVYSATVMLGPALGPLLGGIIIDNYHWSYIFYINVPIGLISMVMVHHFVPKDETHVNSNKKFDFLGVSLLVLGIFSLIWFLERGDRLDWFSDESNIYLAWTVVFSISIFIAHEVSTKNPAIDFTVLRFKIFRITVLLNFILGFIVTATLFLLPIYMQELLNFSPTSSGVAMLPRALFMMIAFPLVGLLIKRVDPKYLIFIGCVIGMYSAYLMSLFTHYSGMRDMIIPQILQGLAVVLTLTPLTTIGFMSVSRDKLSSAAGLDSTSRLLGGVIGIAFFATLHSHFQEVAWSNIRENVSLSYSVFFKRFDDVEFFWLTTGSSSPEAQLQSTYLLYGRVTEQVLAIAYMKSFQVIMALFCFMLVLSVVSKLRKVEV